MAIFPYWHYRRFVFTILWVLNIAFLYSQNAHAVRAEKAIAAGLAFYSGTESTNFAPDLTGQITFAANLLPAKHLNIINRFGLGYAFQGLNFAGSLGTYTAYIGTYEFGVRINMGRVGLLPYFEGGPALGLFAATLTTDGTETISKNQTALKYGYHVGVGFDWMKERRGNGNGWGIGFSYFNYLKNISNFEFPAGSLQVRAIKVELRYLMNSKN
ncbi:MAG: hypothetical protein AB7F43_03060 [Bacteriovoracia bacterium]